MVKGPVPAVISTSKFLVAPWQIGPAAVFNENSGGVHPHVNKTLNTTSALSLSQPPMVCVTQYDVIPRASLKGAGSVVEPVPPISVEYHVKFVPVT